MEEDRQFRSGPFLLVETNPEGSNSNAFGTTPCTLGAPGCTKELIETETAGKQAARGLIDTWEKGGRKQAMQLWRRLQQTQNQQEEASRREQESRLHLQKQEEALKRQQTEQSYYTEEQVRNGRIAEALKRAFEGIGRAAQERNQRIQAIQPIQPIRNNNIHCTQRPDGFGGSRTDCY